MGSVERLARTAASNVPLDSSRFASIAGTPLGHRNVTRRGFEPARDLAGLPSHLTFHDLRHFYASTLIAANIHPKVIQQRLGHATISETMDTYGHLFPEAEEAGRGAIDSVFSRLDTEAAAR